jgi:RHS repeat-associated protein
MPCRQSPSNVKTNQVQAFLKSIFFALTLIVLSAAHAFARYDTAGNVVGRNTVGTGAETQALTWDAQNRLVKFSQRNTGTNDFDSTSVYDGLGRRVETIWQPMSSGVNNGAASSIVYSYDPQVEFLELGRLVNGYDTNNDPNAARTWNVYGPDRSGRYGGAQGEGGLESEIDEAGGSAIIPINNYFGDALGEADVPGVVNPESFYTWGYGTNMSGYGYAPGSYYYEMTPQWRGHYVDWTGLIYKGARYYDFQSGRFLSADPMGHAGSMDLYSYCNGDPVNGLDPDGRFGSTIENDASQVWQSVNDAQAQVGQNMLEQSQAGIDSWNNYDSAVSNAEDRFTQADANNNDNLANPSLQAYTYVTLYDSGVAGSLYQGLSPNNYSPYSDSIVTPTLDERAGDVAFGLADYGLQVGTAWALGPTVDDTTLLQGYLDNAIDRFKYGRLHRCPSKCAH